MCVCLCLRIFFTDVVWCDVVWCAGVSWSLVTSTPGWSTRYRFAVSVLSDGSVVLLGGKNSGGSSNEVWLWSNPVDSGECVVV